jgi:hypothetical protein
VRIELLSAIKDYADALAAANDPALGASVGAAADALTASLGSFVAAKQAAGGASVESAGAFVSSTAAAFTQWYTAGEMRRAMRAVHPTLREACERLVADMEGLETVTALSVAQYRDTLNRKLEIYQGDPRLSARDRREEFILTADEYADLKQRQRAFSRIGPVLMAIVKAHESLMNDSDDDRTVGELLALVNGLATGIAKMKTE